MKVKARVSIQTPAKLHAPGETLTVDQADGERFISNGHAEYVGEPDSEPDPDQKPARKGGK